MRAPLQVDKDDPNSYLMFPVPQPSGGVLSVADYAITWYNGIKQVMTDSAFLNVSHSLLTGDYVVIVTCNIVIVT